MELFNWYIDFLDKSPYICGDIVTAKLRHDDFVVEKLSGVPHKTIMNNDEKYRNARGVRRPCNYTESGFYMKYPDDRHMVFIREPIKQIVNSETIIVKSGKTYTLMNMDSFFQKSKKMMKKYSDMGLEV